MKIICKGQIDITVQISCDAIAIWQQAVISCDGDRDLVSVSDAEQAKALIAAIKDNAERLGWKVE